MSLNKTKTLNKAKLINVNTKEEVTIYNNKLSIGRGANSDLVLLEMCISRLHCTIKKAVSNDNGEKWIITDTSSNGTLVAGQLLKKNQSQELKDGDKIHIGNEEKTLEFMFVNQYATLPQSSSGAPRPPSSTGVAAVVVDDSEPTPPPHKRQKMAPTEDNSHADMEEFVCSICVELFVNAVTLTCSHSFCLCCIQKWRKSHSDCPICRARITSVAPTRVLDNYIQKYGDGQTAEWRQKRAEIVKQKQELLASITSSSRSNPIIDLAGESDEGNEDSDEDNSDMDSWTSSSVNSWGFSEEDEDVPYNGRPGAYFGGYGRCFVCGDSGHWANGCPLK